MRIAVLGGGPGGLFFAALAASADPAREVVVLERNQPDDTFGFGVVFSDATLAAVHDADPVLRTALEEHGVHWDAIEVRAKGERIRCGGNGMAAVVRRTLLRLLQERAVAAGAQLRFGVEADADALLADGFDLVVAADGANSRTREALADRFGPTVEVARVKFVWFGTTYPFEGLTFVHERGEHGLFAVHGYPITPPGAPGRPLSTFIVETDEATWRAAGLDAFDVDQPPGASDEHSRAYLEKLFAEQIDGCPLLVNNSRWGNFRTRAARRWSAGRIALLGDAAHTAHFSVGSGTKMAMEDALALAAALDEHPDDAEAALVAYEAAARPSVDRIQGSARPSLSWWERFGLYHDAFEPWQFAYHFLTRSITDARLRRRDPGYVDGAHASWAARHGGAEPLETPLALGAAVHPGRLLDVAPPASGSPGTLGRDHAAVPLRRHAPDVPERPWALWVDAPDDEVALSPVLEALPAAAAAGAVAVVVAGGAEVPRRLVAEDARLRLGLPAVVVAGPPEGPPDGRGLDRALTLVLSGRADAVGLPP